MRVLLTSGGTKISIDKVRSITNMSSGTFGSAICKAFLEEGHDIDFLMADGSKNPFELRLTAQGRFCSAYTASVLAKIY
jgi:phosphopantothenoylcysteine synthetase/decarboxylase